MKRFELILLLLSFVTVAFAYAGFADRYGDMFVSMNTLGVIITPIRDKIAISCI